MSEMPNPIPKRPSLFRRVLSPSSLRRWLFALACLVTLIAIFYAEEDWRGKRAWDTCRRELEAKGEVIDWTAYIPAPVPDDQNIFKAPKMQEWFVKEHFAIGGPQPTNAAAAFALPSRKDTDLLLAEVEIALPKIPPDSQAAGAVLQLNDPAAREQAAKLLREALGPCAMGTKNCVLIARPIGQVKPLHLVLQADAASSVKDLIAFFPSSPLTNSPLGSPGVSYIRLHAAGSNTFRLVLKGPVYDAADYLTWTRPLETNFDLIREALKRPYARIDCDYERPYAIAIPNFVMLRSVAQTLSERTQCHLLLGQPEAAWHELALMHDMCRILLAEPKGKPMTLVAAMINVAIEGLYAGIVGDGLRLHAWREPQLLAIERQVKATDLLTPVVEAFTEERAATARTFEVTKPGDLVKLFNFGSGQRSWRNKMGDSMFALALRCMPRGWFYQNMALGARLEGNWIECADQTNQLVGASVVSETARKVSGRLERKSPYTFLVAWALPNFVKAVQTMAFNQTQVNQAGLACALERYRQAQGQYPETLDALVPHFVEQLPHDLIGGQPLKYLRTPNGRFVLYSIGWNEKDDGGVPGKTNFEGDWVWQ